MAFQQIICLPDLLRRTRAFPEGFFDLIREPIRQGCNLDIGYPPGGKRASGLKPGFQVELFYTLCEDGIPTAQDAFWAQHFHSIPAAALQYLHEHIPENSLIISFEMPSWLQDACGAWQQDYLDIRPSPLRFGRDLYIALRTNSLVLYQRIAPYQVMEEELRLEAASLAAGVRMHQMRLQENGRYSYNLDGCLIFVGQAPYDASLLAPDPLLSPDRSALCCNDFADSLRALAKNRQVQHKPHPFAADFAHEERAALEAIIAQPVGTCFQNAYQILSSEDDVHLVGISSGLLQEAAWFGKTAHTLYQPFVPLASGQEQDLGSFQQVHFHKWLSPGFWHAVLAPQRQAPRLMEITPLAHHYARETLDQWWDHLKVMTWEKSLPIESFERSGGSVLRQRIEALEQGNTKNHRMIVEGASGNTIVWPASGNVRGKISISGIGNTVKFGEHANFDAVIEITGDNNTVTLGEHCRFAGKLRVCGDGSLLSVGAHSTFAKATLHCLENCDLLIGKDCMFSSNIEVRTSDGHSLVDATSGTRLNPAQTITIGDHVWIGRGAVLLKGTYLADHSVVGAGAIVSSRFKHSHTVIAGIPARVVKEGVTWQRERQPRFSQDEMDAWAQN